MCPRDATDFFQVAVKSLLADEHDWFGREVDRRRQPVAPGRDEQWSSRDGLPDLATRRCSDETTDIAAEQEIKNLALMHTLRQHGGATGTVPVDSWSSVPDERRRLVRAQHAPSVDVVAMTPKGCGSLQWKWFSP